MSYKHLMATGEASTKVAVEDIKIIGREWQRPEYQLRTARIKRMSWSLRHTQLSHDGAYSGARCSRANVDERLEG